MQNKVLDHSLGDVNWEVRLDLTNIMQGEETRLENSWDMQVQIQAKAICYIQTDIKASTCKVVTV